MIYPNPGFPIYESMIRFCKAKPVPIPMEEERGFSFDLDLFRDRLPDKTAMVILNSPQNPKGGIIPADDIRLLARCSRRGDILVLSDEIYSRILFEGEFRSIATEHGMLDKTVILDGFSKTYAMTGWRLGYGGDAHDVSCHAVNKLMVNSNSCTASLHAAGRDRGAGVVRRTTWTQWSRSSSAGGIHFVAGLNTVRGFPVRDAARGRSTRFRISRGRG